jgi:hypothetical protein
MGNEDQVGTQTAGVCERPKFPRMKHPDGMSPEAHLRCVVTLGLGRSELGSGNVQVRRDTLLDAEINTIAMAGFCSYFLLAGEIAAVVPEDAVARGRPLPAGRTLCAYGVGLGTLPREITRAKDSALIKQLRAGQLPPALCLSYTYGALERLLQYLLGRFEPDCVAVFGEGVKEANVAQTAQQIKGFFVSDIPVAEIVEVAGRFQGVALVESNEAALLEKGFFPYQLGLSGESHVA